MSEPEPVLQSTLLRIADALDRLAPPPPPVFELGTAEAFIWDPDADGLEAVPKVNRVDIRLLQGIDLQCQQLLENTRRFANGLPANNALLWGARGAGKSSLVKATHAAVNAELAQAQEKSPGFLPVCLIELHREDIPTLPRLLTLLRPLDRRFILFCDDLSFDGQDAAYKSLKAVLEGGIEGRPENVLFYATSNRRHLMPRDMIENERSTAVNPSEAVEEKVSLSDRFGLWLGFHSCDQNTYFEMIRGYIEAYNLPIEEDAWRPMAVEWTVTRGARSGRVAWQFIQDLAGKLGKTL
jgi:hypothetical protein